jgi:hypothetical protein
MTKKLQLQIPTPCHENWENMTRVDKGRFCTSCQKQVIDFSNMSDREIAMFFKKSPHSVWGRFMGDQLNRDIEIPKKRIPWVKYFFQFAIPAFLASCDNRTQGKVKVSNASVIPQPANDTVSKEACTTTVGVLITHIAYDTIRTSSIKNKNPKMTILPDVKLPAIGETLSEIDLMKHNPTIIPESLQAYLGGISVTECGARKISKPVQLLQKIFRDTTINFKIYPNPVQSSSTLNIEWKQKEFGQFMFQLYNQSGQLVFSKEINISDEVKLFTMNMPSIIPGNYFLGLTNKTSGKSYSEKLIVK